MNCIENKAKIHTQTAITSEYFKESSIKPAFTHKPDFKESKQLSVKQDPPTQAN
jgi:hypothetical protein